jgi:hypothetical protein
MRASIATVLTACLAGLATAGCGGQDDSTPVACLEGTGAYLTALRDAPHPVKVGGETAISECLAANQTAGDLSTVGVALVEAATRLNAAARAQPGGDANLELGYLVGAAERGAAETEGIHADLIRRLTVAARFAPDRDPLSQTFRLIYLEGFDAGNARG